MLELVHRGGLDMLAAPELEDEFGIALAFTNRHGGESGGSFSTLDLSFNVGDSRVAVASNRDRVAEFFGIHAEHWVLGQQVHGATVRQVGLLERGRGGRDYWSGLPRTDGLLTDLPGVAVGVLTADCLPVVMAAVVERMVGIAHAGWRGILSGVAPAVLEAVSLASGCPPGEMLAFLGPCIGPCCMEVDEDVAVFFRARFGGGGDVVMTDGTGRSRIDIALACRRQLEGAGVRQASIFESGICTSCDESYFSFRRSGGTTGRQLAVVAVME